MSSSTQPSARSTVTLTVRNSGSASKTSLSQTSPAARMICASTSAIGGARPSNDSSEATPASAIPQGTMAAKSRKSVLTLKAKPWLVIQREMCTPIAPSFPAGVQMPMRPALRSAARPYARAVRIITSSTEATYLRTSFRSGLRSRIGYPTICPGPW